jgi:hypothetical protein
MTSSSNGDGTSPPTLSQRLSGMFLSPGRATGGLGGAGDGTPGEDPNRILTPSERRAAMTSLNPTEAKWAKAALAIAALIGAIVIAYLVVDRPTRKVTQKVHGVNHVHLVPVSDTYLLVGAIVLAFCLLGFEGLRRQRRTLVVFALFIDGFAFTLVFAPLGLALLCVGGWLMLRAYRIQKFGTANTKLAAREAAARPPRRERKQAARTPATPTGHKPPTANKRYTPKAAPRKKVAKPTE